MDESRVVWIINQLAYLPEDGPHIRAYAIGKHLARRGYTVIVFTGNVLHFSGTVIDTGNQLYKEKIRESVRFLYIRCHKYKANDVHRVLNIASFYSNVFKVAEEAESRWGSPSVIVGSTLYPTALLAGIKLARRYNAAMVSETRDIIPDGFQAKRIFSTKVARVVCDAMMRRLYEASDALVFTMSGGKKYIIERNWDVSHGGKINLDYVYYINNGVDLEEARINERLFRTPDPDLDDPEVFTAVYLGAIRFMNRMPLFVDAARSLKAAGRDDIKILLWGAGTKLDDMREELEESGLENIVLKGAVAKSEIPSIAKRADAFLMTSNLSAVQVYGASPNKLFDYFAAGKPIIVPAKISDSIVEANGAGVELDKPTGDDLAKEIIRFADMDKDDYEEYCQCSARMVEQYDYSVLAEQAEKVIHDVLSAAGKTKNL